LNTQRGLRISGLRVEIDVWLEAKAELKAGFSNLGFLLSNGPAFADQMS
jgi:hypothetical protein